MGANTLQLEAKTWVQTPNTNLQTPLLLHMHAVSTLSFDQRLASAPALREKVRAHDATATITPSAATIAPSNGLHAFGALRCRLRGQHSRGDRRLDADPIRILPHHLLPHLFVLVGADRLAQELRDE